MENKILWIISDGHKIGTHNQCYGVASVVKTQAILKKVTPKFPWSFLPPQIWPCPLKCIREELSPPWPHIIIAGGRASVAPAIEIRRQSKAFTIFLQNPQVSLKNFDLIIAPEHDHLQGSNVISVLGAIHNITQDTLQKAGLCWEKTFQDFPRPWVGLLLGGDSQHHKYTTSDIDRLLSYFTAWNQQQGGSFLIAPSRRTRPEIISYLEKKITTPHFIWNGLSENPYTGILALADQLVVTGDSISMLSEACFTGKPIHIFDVGIKKEKFIDFMKQLEKKDHARLMIEKIASWPVQRLDELNRIKPLIMKKISLIL